ncbi:MEDS domain-containing protein [Actinokineospora sp. NPDC004072]
MRAHGVVDSAAGLRPFGHLGWAYRDRAEFIARAREYLADGIAEGQRVEFVGGDGELADLPGLRVAAVEDFFDFDGDAVDPAATVRKRLRAVDAAVADGRTGLRSVVDATAVALTPEHRAAYARFEYLMDQQMSTRPVSAACAFDLDRMGRSAAAELVCLHPFTNAGSSLFRIYADGPAEFALSGELDASSVTAFTTTLDRTLPLFRTDVLRIDGRGLHFIDHRALTRLDALLGGAGSSAVLWTPCPVAARLSDFIDLRHVRVERVAA